MIYLDIVLRWIHILAAIALMGGSIFVRFALLPALKNLPAETRRQLEGDVRSSWSRIVMLAVALLLVTGLVNFGLVASRYEFTGLITTPLYHALLGTKFLLALPIFFIASRLAGRSEAAVRFRENGRFWVSVNLTLALLIVLIAGVLRYADRVPKRSRQASQSLQSEWSILRTDLPPV